MARGDKRCETCNGRGGFRDGFGRWHKCPCTQVTREVRRLQKRLHAPLDAQPKQPKLF